MSNPMEEMLMPCALDLCDGSGKCIGADGEMEDCPHIDGFCEFCRGTRKIEILDSNGFGTGYFKPCSECASVPDIDSQGIKD